MYCCLVAKSCSTLCDLTDCSMPGSSVCHYLPEFTQIHVRWVGDAIRPCHPLLFCLQSFPASVSFSVTRLFVSGGQIIGASASALPMNIQGWFPLGWTCWSSLQSKGLSSLLKHHSSKASILWCSAFLTVPLSSSHVLMWELDHTEMYTILILNAQWLISFSWIWLPYQQQSPHSLTSDIEIIDCV